MGKLSIFVSVILVVGLTFAVIGSIVDDFEDSYPDIDVNTSWSDEYDYSERVNDTVYDIKEDFDVITDEDKGWFERLGAGVTAIPEAIIVVPSIIFKTFVYAVTIMTDVGEEVGIPPFVITFGVVALIVGIIFILVSYWRRYEA